MAPTRAASAPRGLMMGDETIRFAEKLIGLLEDGSFVATYKYAVLLGLIDLCMEQTQQSGAPPAMVTTTQLAQKVLAAYWPHTRGFGEATVFLRQNSGGQAKILSLIRRFQNEATVDPNTTLHRVRLSAPGGIDQLRMEIEWVLVQYPLPRVQKIGQREDRFIYDISWSESVRRREWRSSDSFDNRIHFTPGASANLVRLAGLLKPLIQRKWSSHVARLNASDVPESHLDDFLFGMSRQAMNAVRAPLVELQEDQCFYCGDRFRTSIEVDHFIPWSRLPDNGLDNLVAAHGQCNRSKRDFLASERHLSNWGQRFLDHEREVARIAHDVGWERNPPRTVGVVRGIYSRIPEGVPLWHGTGEYRSADGALLVQALAALDSIQASDRG